MALKLCLMVGFAVAAAVTPMVRENQTRAIAVNSHGDLKDVSPQGQYSQLLDTMVRNNQSRAIAVDHHGELEDVSPQGQYSTDLSEDDRLIGRAKGHDENVDDGEGGSDADEQLIQEFEIDSTNYATSTGSLISSETKTQDTSQLDLANQNFAVDASAETSSEGGEEESMCDPDVCFPGHCDKASSRCVKEPMCEETCSGYCVDGQCVEEPTLTCVRDSDCSSGLCLKSSCVNKEPMCDAEGKLCQAFHTCVHGQCMKARFGILNPPQE